MRGEVYGVDDIDVSACTTQDLHRKAPGAFTETDRPPAGTEGVVQRPEAASAVCLDGEPLARFRIASADRPEDALAIQMSRSAVYRISSPDCDEAYRFRLNLASLAGMRIGFVSHGRPTRVDLRGSASVSITWTENGHGRVTTRGRSMVTSTDQGALAVPDHECSFDYGQNCRRIDFGFVPGVMERYLTSALGVTPRGSFSLHPEFDMSAGAGAALKRFVRFVTAELDSGEAILTNPGAAAGLQDAVLSMLLHHHPHSHSQHFSSDARTAVPAVVRRVEEYLATQATEAVSMTDLPRGGRRGFADDPGDVQKTSRLFAPGIPEVHPPGRSAWATTIGSRVTGD